MSFSKDYAQDVAKHAIGYNFDKLIETFTHEDTPKNIHNDLRSLYFDIVEHIGRKGDIFPGMVDSMFTLQRLIEAIETMYDLNGKCLDIRAEAE